MAVVLAFVSCIPLLASVLIYIHGRAGCRNTDKNKSANKGKTEYEKKGGACTRRRDAGIILFGVYLCALFFLTVVSRAVSENTPGFIFDAGGESVREYLESRVNLEPFSTVFRITDGWRRGYVTNKTFFYNIAGNMLLLTPLAYFHKKLFREHGAGTLFVAALTVSLFIETAQLASMTGSFDIDDIILNVAGALGAYFLTAEKSKSSLKAEPPDKP